MIIGEFGSGQVFLAILWVFLFVIWFWLLITIFTDLWRQDMNGWLKALWVVFVIVVPFLGILVYLIAHGRGMQERAIEEQQRAERQFRGYVRETAGGESGTASELEKLSDLKDRGVISEDEFAQQKSKLLG